jgi:O-antigen/teichoic acid export membrane protein
MMAFPACAAISTQGVTLLIGLVLGPIAVAIFNPMRTLARVVLQFSNAVLNSVWPELSAAFGQGNWGLARKLHRTACQVTLWSAVFFSIALAITGPRIFAVWTHNRIAIDLNAFYLLLAGVLAYSGWSASSAVPLSSNRHQRLALVYMTCTSASIILASVLIEPFKLAGVAFALLLGDLAMAVCVLRISNKLLSDPWPEFAASLFDMKQFNTIRTALMRRAL